MVGPNSIGLIFLWAIHAWPWRKVDQKILHAEAKSVISDVDSETIKRFSRTSNDRDTIQCGTDDLSFRVGNFVYGWLADVYETVDTKYRGIKCTPETAIDGYGGYKKQDPMI